MPPHHQQRRPYPSPPPSIHPSHEAMIPLQHPIRSLFSEQPWVQGPSVQELANTGRLPGSPRVTLAMARTTGPGTRVGIIRRSDMVFENLMSDTPQDGEFDFGVGPEMVRKRTTLQKMLPLQKKDFGVLRDMEPLVKTGISSKLAGEGRHQTDNTNVAAVAADEFGIINPEPSKGGHDSFSTDDSFNSLDSVVIHDADLQWEFKNDDPILNPRAGRLRFRNRASFTVFAKSVGLLHIEEDEQETRLLTVAGVEDYREPHLPRSKFPKASARSRTRSPSPPRRPRGQTAPVPRRKLIRVPSPNISGKLRKRSVRDLSPKPTNNHKRSRSSTPPTPSMGSRFAQHLIARAGGNEIVNQAVINDDNECIDDSNLSDPKYPSAEEAPGQQTAKPAPKRVKVKAHTKIVGLQGAYRTLRPAYPFEAPLRGSRFVLAGEATSLEEAFQQSREAESRMGYSPGLATTTGPETSGANSPLLAPRGAQTSTARHYTTPSDYLFGGTPPRQEIRHADAHLVDKAEEQLKTNRMQGGHHLRMDIPPATAAQSENLLWSQLRIPSVHKDARVQTLTGDSVRHPNIKKRLREPTDPADGEVLFSITQPARDARKHQLPSSGVFGTHNELGQNLQASNMSSNSLCANSTEQRPTPENMDNSLQSTPAPHGNKMAAPHSVKNQRQDPRPAQLQRQHNHAYPFQPHPSTDPSLWPQIANHPPFPRIQPNQEPCSPIKELISGDTTAIDIAEVKSRGPTCFNPANACLVHRGMKETPENPHFEELQDIRGTKRLQINTGNMEYLEKKIHQGKLESIDYVPDSEFRTHYHDSQGYWTADRSTGQLNITDGVLNVQSARGASWDCTTENGTKVAGRGYLESNHVADAGQEKQMHDAHQLGFSQRAKRIPPIVVTATLSAHPMRLLSAPDIEGKLLQPGDVNWNDFLVDDDAPATHPDVVIGVGKGFIHGAWQFKGTANAEARTGPSNALTPGRGSLETHKNLEFGPMAEDIQTGGDVTITTTGGRDTGSDSDLDSIIGQLREEDPQVIQVGDFSVFIAPRNEDSPEAGLNQAKNSSTGVTRRAENKTNQLSPDIPDLHATICGFKRDNPRVVQRENGAHILNARHEVVDDFKHRFSPIKNADEPAASADRFTGAN